MSIIFIEFLMIAITIIACIILSIIDWKHYVIPLPINILIAVCSSVIAFIHWENIGSHIGACIIPGTIFLLLHIATKGQGLGGGDVKLMYAAGLGLGMANAVLAFILSFVLASIIHPLCMVFLNKDKRLAFGPYMSIGIIIAHLFGNGIIGWYLNLFGLRG